MPFSGNQNFTGANYPNPGFAGQGFAPGQGMMNPGMASTTATMASGANSSLGLNDRDLFDILLSQHKLLAESMTQTILESSNPQFRQDCINMLNRDFMHQRVIWEAMNQRGWYNTSQGMSQGQGMTQQGMSMGQQQTGSGQYSV
ncbi:MAG: spore coat protein [Firmicutes bacterium]|nr:spore coat protein [Bacillota bacterium]